MAGPKDYRDLIVWQKAMQLARCAYQLSGGFPNREASGLIGQLRRAAISVPSNIAEGHGRLTDSQFRHFLGNAGGSLYELQTQMELARDLGYLGSGNAVEFFGQSAEVARLINGLISSLREDHVNPAKSQIPLTARSSAHSASSANAARPGLHS